ncbi:hypothetical protein GGE45_005900 [Rhizobium aethiopicum]|nr:hypothetical protein [Rhizobium aethiopicum]
MEVAFSALPKVYFKMDSSVASIFAISETIRASVRVETLTERPICTP